MKGYLIRVGEKSITLTPAEKKGVRLMPLETVLKNALFTAVLGERGEVGMIAVEDKERFKELFSREMERLSNLSIKEWKNERRRRRKCKEALSGA